MNLCVETKWHNSCFVVWEKQKGNFIKAARYAPQVIYYKFSLCHYAANVRNTRHVRKRHFISTTRIAKYIDRAKKKKEAIAALRGNISIGVYLFASSCRQTRVALSRRAGSADIYSLLTSPVYLCISHYAPVTRKSVGKHNTCTCGVMVWWNGVGMG